MQYVRFSLSLRNVEDLVDELSVYVSYGETRQCWNRVHALLKFLIKLDLMIYVILNFFLQCRYLSKSCSRNQYPLI